MQVFQVCKAKQNFCNLEVSPLHFLGGFSRSQSHRDMYELISKCKLRLARVKAEPTEISFVQNICFWKCSGMQAKKIEKKGKAATCGLG
jgi:hypothetical protein